MDIKLFFFTYILLFLFYLPSMGQNGNNMTIGSSFSGAHAFYTDKNIKDLHVISISPSLGFQVMENHYIYLTGGWSISNFLEQEAFHFGYITRKFLMKHDFLNIFVGHNLALTNFSYENINNKRIQVTNHYISGFRFGMEGGVHMRLYKNFGVLLNTGYTYEHGRGFFRNHLLNMTLQLDIHNLIKKPLIN